MASFSEIINSDTPVLVDFTASWCGPCKTMNPIINDLAKEIGDDARILKVDIDKNPSTASKYQVRSVPTFLIIKKGVVVWRQSGVLTVSQLKSEILKHR